MVMPSKTRFYFFYCRVRASPTITTCASEQQLAQVYNAAPTQAACIPTPHVDSVSVSLLRRFHGAMLDCYTPVATVGDGNCLYRAASLALHGSQDYHIYLRLITAMELICHRNTYTDATMLPDSNYDHMLSSALQVGEYSEMGHVYALSAAIGAPIQSYMPQAGITGCENPYARTVYGRDVRPTAAPKFMLMWTMTTKPARWHDFAPNHFVFMSPHDAGVHVAVSDDDNNATSDAEPDAPAASQAQDDISDRLCSVQILRPSC